MSKNLRFGKEAREALLRGVDFLANAVAITEGPRGRCVILGQRVLGQSPKVTRDGVTVANYADPSDPTEQLGADLVREAAQKTDNAVGDGTTAAIVLAQSMIHEGFRLIDAGANPMAMERGIHKATDAIIARLTQMAVPCSGSKIAQVATVSAHGDALIGTLVAGAVETAGKDGVVTVEPSSTSDTRVDTVAGIELEKSNLLHSAFITHPEDMIAQWEDCRILLWEGVIATARSLVPILSQVKEEADKHNAVPLLIIAGGYEQEALAVIIKARLGIALPIIAVRMDAYGERRKEVMRDIAALTGGKAYTEDMGLKIESIKLADLGRARKVITSMSKTQIIEGRGNQSELVGRIDYLRQCIDNASPAERKPLQQRLAALLGGITIIKVGGVTVTEMEEKKDRVVDAMSAAKAAVESGIVPGGGTALLQASVVLAGLKTSVEEHAGILVVWNACRAVAKQIAENAGIDGDVLLTQLMATSTLGYNALSGAFEDLVESGIIDPVKVVCESLKNASAVSCSILTMGATVAEVAIKHES
jgi:chaperonin GroEL